MAAANKTRREARPAADFIAAVEPAAKRADAEALAAMFARLSGEAPYMYGPTIVGFGTYHYRYDSEREGDAPRIAFSPRASALVLYLKLDGQESETLLARLGKHRTGKGCLYVNKLADVDAEVVEALVALTLADMDRRYPRQP